MNFTRRAFLGAGVRSAAALPLIPVGRLAAAGPQDASAAPGAPDWVRDARDQIPASASPFFQTGGIGPSPRGVIEAVAERLEFQNRSPAHPSISGPMGRIEPDLRAQLARVFGARPEEVALTHSTSEGISIVAWSLDWRAGDEVIISNTEHPANVIPWYVLRDRLGIAIREIDLSPGTDFVDEVRRELTSRTRMVSVSHVSRNNGRRLRTGDCARLAELLRARGVRFHLDGAQGPGLVPTDFAALGCDAYSTCGHKWLLGPKGTGALFVRREILDEVLLSWAGAHSHAAMDYQGGYELLPSAARFEFGTRALADFHGFGRAVAWLEDLGLDRVLARVEELAGFAAEAARRSPTLSLASPETAEDASGIVVVRLPEGCDALALYRDLGEEGILASPVRDERDFRLSVHFFNTREEISVALNAIEARCS